jgi:hypothetical protein
MRARLVRLALVSAIGLASGAVPQAQSPGIQDAWYADSYVLKDGEEHHVEGLMLFSEHDWAVVYFVDDERGTPQRAAGEGGTYTLDGNRLVLTRLYLTISSNPLKSLPAIPLRFDVPANKDPVIERCTIELDAERLEITFPSGNRMGFRRSRRAP